MALLVHVEPVVVLPVLEPHLVGDLLDLAEDLGQGGEQLGGAGRRPQGHDASRREPVVHLTQERRGVQVGVAVVDQVAGAVVDVEQHDVVRRGRGLGESPGDVADHRTDPAVGEQARTVGDGAVPHPVDERRLDLDHDTVLDPAVAEHAVEGEPETEPADQHASRLVDQGEGGVGERLLRGVLAGVHHEDAVGPELQNRRRATVRRTLPQEQLTALGPGPRHLDVLHDHHASVRADLVRSVKVQ